MEPKNPAQIFKNSGCGSKELQSGGGAEKFTCSKVERPQALIGGLEAPDPFTTFEHVNNTPPDCTSFELQLEFSKI